MRGAKGANIMTLRKTAALILCLAMLLSCLSSCTFGKPKNEAPVQSSNVSEQTPGGENNNQQPADESNTQQPVAPAGENNTQTPDTPSDSNGPGNSASMPELPDEPPTPTESVVTQPTEPVTQPSEPVTQPSEPPVAQPETPNENADQRTSQPAQETTPPASDVHVDKNGDILLPEVP